MEPSPARTRRSRLFVIAFVVLLIAISIFAAILIRSGRQDAEFQQELEELQESGR